MSELPTIEATPSPEALFGPSFKELTKALAEEGLLMSKLAGRMDLLDLNPPEEVKRSMIEKYLPELDVARVRTQEARAKWLEVIG